MNDEYVNSIIRKLVAFGEKNDSVRAMVLTSSLANPNAPADILSDFDIEFFFDDPMPFVEDDSWVEAMGFGQLMAVWRWPNPWDREQSDGRTHVCMVYFLDGTKMDIALRYLSDLRDTACADELPRHYDIGYRVLLDKNGVTSSMKSPTYKAFILSPPSEKQFITRVETFWMNSTYVAKYLWRDDPVAAKWMLNEIANFGLREVMEWLVGSRKEWGWKPGNIGRGLSKVLDSDTCGELIEAYRGGDIDDLWKSLFRTTALYRKAAIEVGEGLGYKYPNDLDERVSNFHRTLRDLPKSSTREDLARKLKETE